MSVEKNFKKWNRYAQGCSNQIHILCQGQGILPSCCTSPYTYHLWGKLLLVSPNSYQCSVYEMFGHLIVENRVSDTLI